MTESADTPAFSLRDALDLLFVVVLCAAALAGFRATFTGIGYVIATAAGIAVATAVSAFVRWRRWPVWTAVPLLIIGYYLFGGVVVLRDEAIGHVLTNLSVLRDLSTVLVDGWKRLVTTLPPVAATGRLLAVPYVIAMIGAAIGACAALRSRSLFGPAIGPALAYAAVTLLGTAHPAARLWQGITFGCLVVCWAALRGSGDRVAMVHRTPGGLQRVVIGVLVLGIAGAGAAWVGGRLPGHGSHRVVLRNYVRPPFDLAAYASPLAGFRMYTKDADLLYDQPLFRIRGLPAGVPVRIAALDDYNGLVWGATNGTAPTGPGQPIDAFQRVGSRITSDATGPTRQLTVTIEKAYATTPDIDAWVPTVGVLRSITFAAGSTTADDAFRYNLSTATGVTSDPLGSDDSYTFTAAGIASPVATLPARAQPNGAPTLPTDEDSFVASRATQWAADAGSVVGQVSAVAAHLRAGAYSDGGPGESQYLPGHSISRITAFLDAAQPVGDDEQYAAAFALMSNYLGLPARVVLLAEPQDGVVRGRDVHAGVEVDVRSAQHAGWLLLDRSFFMPAQNAAPGQDRTRPGQDVRAAVVPPVAAERPPTSFGQTGQPNAIARPRATAAERGALSGWVGVLVYVVGVLLALVVVGCLLIGAIKWRRRALRRTRGAVADRFDAGWRELLDWAGDLGTAIPAGRTRGEQAGVLAARPAGATAHHLAAAADAGVFGPTQPVPEAAAAYWRQVDDARRAMARASGRFGRLRATLNLRSLRRPTRAVRPV